MRHVPEYSPVTVATGVEYLGWKAIQLKRGKLDLYLVPEIGGRIMGIQYNGQELSYVQPDKQGIAPLLPDRFELEQWRSDLKFPLWGGGKTWLSPEDKFPGGTPYPDLDSGPYKYEICSHGADRIEVTLTSIICRDTRIRIRRTISLDCLEPFWIVDHHIENCGHQKWTGGIWDALMLQRRGEVILPANLDSVHVFEGKGDKSIGKKSISISNKYTGCLHITCDQPPGFKVGVQVETGWMLANLNNNIGYLRRFDLDKNSTFTHGWPAEVYNSTRYPYFTIESHSGKVSLKPGEVARFEVVEQVDTWENFANKISNKEY